MGFFIKWPFGSTEERSSCFWSAAKVEQLLSGVLVTWTRLRTSDYVVLLSHFVSWRELWVAVSQWAGVCPRPSSCLELVNVHSLWGRWPAEVFEECLRVVDLPMRPRSFFCVQSDWSSIPGEKNDKITNHEYSSFSKTFIGATLLRCFVWQVVGKIDVTCMLIAAIWEIVLL